MVSLSEEDAQDLLVLTSVPHEVEAAAIVAMLAEEGIRAMAAGGNISGFKAEAPGEVEVLIRRADAERAGEALRAMQSDDGAVDWSQVDVGEPEPE